MINSGNSIRYQRFKIAPFGVYVAKWITNKKLIKLYTSECESILKIVPKQIEILNMTDLV